MQSEINKFKMFQPPTYATDYMQIYQLLDHVLSMPQTVLIML